MLRHTAMDLRQLRYFVKIADVGSLSRASQVLHIAQPALSQHVAQLEAELGHKLLIRKSTGVQVTEQGGILYSRAQRVLKQVAEIRAAVDQSVDVPSGTVAVGLPQSTACQYAMPLLDAVRSRYPGVALEFFDEISGNLLRGLDSGRLDMAVIVSDDDAGLLDSTPVLDETLFLVSHRDQAPGSPTVSLQELAGLPLALPGFEHGVRGKVEATLRAAGVDLPRPRVVANSMSIMRQAVLEGLAHCVLPWGAVAEDIRLGTLVMTAVVPSLTRRVYFCTSRSTELTAAGRVVMALLLEIAQERVRSGGWQGASLLAP
jgi:LysR family nitrogen assimilation transcriptional regulator